MIGTLDPWTILGIEPGSDFRRVRKAYAERLKQTHPEEDPQGFMRLREAYEILRRSLSPTGGFTPSLSPTPCVVLEPESEPPPIPKSPVQERVSPLAPAWDVLGSVKHLMEQVKSICRDPRRCESVGDWRALLEDEDLWWVDVRVEFGNQLLEFLASSDVDPGWAVWILLQEEFRWRERGLDLLRDLDVDSVEGVLKRVERAISEKPPYYLQFRELFTLSESRDPSSVDRIPYLGVLVDHFGWFAAAATLLVLWLA